MADTTPVPVAVPAPSMPPVENMTDTEMLREIVTTMREVSEALRLLEQSPIIQGMMQGGGMLSMMGIGR